MDATDKALDAAQKALDSVLGDISNKNVKFTTATSASTLTSGETLGTMIGQINKWLVDSSEEITQEDNDNKQTITISYPITKLNTNWHANSLILEFP